MSRSRWLLLLLLVLIPVLLIQSRQVAEAPQGLASVAAAKSTIATNPTEASIAPRPKEVINQLSTKSPMVANTDQVTVAAAATAQPQLSPSEARALMLARARDRDCEYARTATADTSQAKSQWPWLPPERALLEQKAFEEARLRFSAGCAQAPNQTEKNRRYKEWEVQLQAAQRPGDLYARLETYPRGRHTPEVRAQARQTLYDAVLSGDPEAIARMPILASIAQPPNFFDPQNMVGHYELWPLVACDLGMDCGPASRALDRACLTQGAGCGYAHLADFHRDNMPAWQYRLLEARRREVVERIRTGNVAGLFEPPVPTGGP